MRYSERLCLSKNELYDDNAMSPFFNEFKCDVYFVVGIDPGPEECGVAVVMQTLNDEILSVQGTNIPTSQMQDFLFRLRMEPYLQAVGVECVTAYGRSVKQEVFDTCYIAGFISGFLSCVEQKVYPVSRKEVSSFVKGDGDTKVRSCIIKMLDEEGLPYENYKRSIGGTDQWAALGVALLARKLWITQD